MSIEQAYNNWASQYDTNKNRTRDLEGQALRQTLAEIPFKNCLEIGCGTGKNTEWLVQKAEHVLAVDLSAGMLEKAQAKIKSDRVTFLQADITKPWNFGNGLDLVSFSLVLEHIENLDPVFAEVAKGLNPGGHVYIGELHPFKQYGGTKARFETEHGRQEVTCFTHHLSEFIQTARKHKFEILDVNEFFDADDKTAIPRILTILLRKL